MLIEQKIFSILISLSILGIILELVRRRKLHEEYAWLWITTGIIILLLASFDPLIIFITRLFKAQAPTSVIYFLSLVFLLLINLHFSVSISTLKTNLKDLTQKSAILENEYRQLLTKEKESR